MRSTLPCLTSLRRILCHTLVAAAIVAPARAATINVSPGQSIQSAINTANNGDTVLVAPGTYYENLRINGKQITLQSEQGADKTIIDGGQNDTVITISNTSSLATTISGFTLQNGKNASQSITGAIYIDQAGATINNMTFGPNYGGQILVQNGSATISS